MYGTRLVICFQDAAHGVPSVVRVLPWGHVSSASGDFIVNEESARLIVEAFEEAGVDLPWDLEHTTVYGDQTGMNPAVGWITGFEVRRGDGIYAHVDWTDRGHELLTSKAYRYHSPVVIVRDSDKVAVELHSVALTNKPAIQGSVAIVNGQAGLWPLLRSRPVRDRQLGTIQSRAYSYDGSNRSRGGLALSVNEARGQRRASAVGTEIPYQDLRRAVINRARSDYRGQGCSLVAHVDEGLRDHGLRCLTWLEVRALGGH